MLLFAHRGAPAYAPENTLPSFRKALELGARAVELDVQLTSDGVPVVIHDFYLSKTTNGSGLVHDTSWRDIRKLDAAYRFGKDFSDVLVPSLEEVLEVLPPEVMLNIELKSISLFREDTARRVLELLEREKRNREVVFSSFNHLCLKDLREQAPSARIGILTASHLLDFVSYIKSTGLNPWSLHPEASYLTEEYAALAHKEGWKVFCWTVNTPGAAGLAARCGADGFFSDYPDLLDRQ